MLRYAFHDALCLTVIVADGTPNSDEELERLVATLERFDREAGARNQPTAMVMVAESLASPPSALWRRRIAELRKHVRAPLACVSFVSDSALLRGVGIAIDWIIAAPPNLRSVQHATLNEAAAWVEQTHGAPASLVLSLAEQARGSK